MESKTMLTIVSACFLVSWTTRATSSTSSALVITPAPVSSSSWPSSSRSSSRSSCSCSSKIPSSSPPKSKLRHPPIDDALEHRFRAILGEEVEQRALAAARPHPGRIAFDAAELSGRAHGVVDRADLVDELQRPGLLAGEDAAVGDPGHLFRFHPALAPFRDVAHELRMQLRDDALEVLPFGVGQLAVRDRKSVV